MKAMQQQHQMWPKWVSAKATQQRCQPIWATMHSIAIMPTYRRVHCAHGAAAVGQIMQARCA
eukprot:12330-Heterococcus_DN1.PRE.4